MDQSKDNEEKGSDYDEAWQAELKKRFDDVKDDRANLVSSEVAVLAIRKKIFLIT